MSEPALRISDLRVAYGTMPAVRGVSLTDTPRGPVKFDHFGNVIGDFYIRKLGKEGAKYGLKLWNKTIKTYKDVSQFWTYDEKKFLEQPVYSRDYPPSRYLEP